MTDERKNMFSRFACIIDLLPLSGIVWIPILGMADISSSIPETEYTIAQPLTLDEWFSDSTTVEPSLFGEWQMTSGETLSILPLPVAANTCLVSHETRLVPGFFFELEGERFLIIGDQASEDLRLIPTVYRFEITKDLGEIEFTQLDLGFEDGVVSSPEMLKERLVEIAADGSGESQKKRFHRI